MKTKKLLTYIPVAIMTASLAVLTVTPPLILNSNLSQNILKASQSENKIQTVSNISEINFELSYASGSAFAIVKDDVNGDLLYGWGYNNVGQLGIGTTANTNLPQLCQFANLPDKAVITAVYSSMNATAVVVNGTELYMAGSNGSGLQGNGSVDLNAVVEFTRNAFISDLGGTITHAAIANHAIVAVDNDIYAWGYNTYGQIGDGTSTTAVTPAKINGIFGSKINGVYATTNNSYAWVDNNIYAWGNYKEGSIGNADLTDDVKTPALVSLPNGNVTSFSAGEDDSDANSFWLAVLDNTKLYACGGNYNGQLGNDSMTNQITPVEITNLPATGNILKTYAGWAFSAIQIENELYMAGRNSSGQLCDGASEEVWTFQKMQNYLPEDSTEYQLFVTGGMANTNGIYSFWGSNEYGTFGNGSNGWINVRPVLCDSIGMPSELIPGSDNSSISAANALKAINPSGTDIDKLELAKYVNGIDSFPNNATFTVSGDPKVNDEDGIITLTLVADESYSAEALKLTTPVEFPIVIAGFAKTIAPTVPEDQSPTENLFPWWWIVIAIGGAVIIGIIIWLLINNKRKKDAQSLSNQMRAQAGRKTK